jgi:PAS domain S-box-containing protein
MTFKKLTSKASVYTSVFIIALFLILFIGIIAYRQILVLRETKALIHDSNQISIELERLFSYVKDAETGQRGFIITRDSAYLRLYNQAQVVISNSIARLKDFTKDNPEERAMLEELYDLIAIRLAILHNTLILIEDGSTIVLSQQMEKGTTVMDSIRAQINRLMGTESNLLLEREHLFEKEVSLTPFFYFLLVLFTLVILFFSFYNSTKDRNSLKESNEYLEEANKQLIMSNSIYSHAEQVAMVGSYVWNTQTGELKFSDNLYRLLGTEPGSYKPTTEDFMRMIHPEDRETALHDQQLAITDQIITQRVYRIYTPDGTLKYFRSTGRSFHEKNTRLLIGTLQDVSNNIMLNESLISKHTELLQSEERYHRMISEVQDYAIILLDKDGIIQNWNKGAEKIKGYAEEEIIGKSFKIFYPEEDIASDLPGHLLNEARTKGRATHEGWRVRKDGSRFWGSIVITALHDDQQDIAGFTKVTRDLTVQKNAEDRLLQYTRAIENKNRELKAINAELASFNHIASHDLQEPLRKIQTFISRIMDQDLSNLSQKSQEYFSRVRTSANRMQNLIEDLITYSHANKGEKAFEIIDLDYILQIVKESLAPTIEEKNAIIRSEELPTLRVIPFQCEQLFTNIIENALKYHRPGVPPEISITAKVVDKSEAPAPQEPTVSRYHKISISDNGIGFESQYAQSIFTLFRRLHGKMEYSGTGIGLAICKKIVENHHGFITAEGKLNEGSTFHIYLPA